jgi:hypothetical protein
MSQSNSKSYMDTSGKAYSQVQVDGWKKAFDQSVNTSTKQSTKDTQEPEPIPLRTLTTLLNYERCRSDPRFQGIKLLHSTFADPTLTNQLSPEMRQLLLGSQPPSVKQIHLHAFGPDSDNFTATLSSYDAFHPTAGPTVRSLTFAQRELIYHESRDHDGCYKALALYQHFLDLCPVGQKLSIQIKNEEPVLVDRYPRSILEFKMKGPKQITISTGLPTAGTIVIGSEQESLHSVLAFPRPGSKFCDFVVDMTRMQFGEAGRGTFGEPYFLGSTDAFMDIMKNVCDEVEELGIGASHVGMSEHTEVLNACAERVWDRWQNREKEGWCDYCGVGSAERRLLDCSACKKVKVRYCCKEHQKAGWKLHKFTCEKNKKVI